MRKLAHAHAVTGESSLPGINYANVVDDLLAHIAALNSLIAEDGDASGLLHELEEARTRIAALEREAAEAREEIERLRHGLDEEGLSLAERCCGSIKDHLAKRAEEAERQRDDALKWKERAEKMSVERKRQRDALRAEALSHPRSVRWDGQAREYVDVFCFCTLCHALDAAWPTWREGAGEEVGDG